MRHEYFLQSTRSEALGPPCVFETAAISILSNWREIFLNHAMILATSAVLCPVARPKSRHLKVRQSLPAVIIHLFTALMCCILWRFF